MQLSPNNYTINHELRTDWGINAAFAIPSIEIMIIFFTYIISLRLYAKYINLILLQFLINFYQCFYFSDAGSGDDGQLVVGVLYYLLIYIILLAASYLS